jgi:Right handed beta helix region
MRCSSRLSLWLGYFVTGCLAVSSERNEPLTDPTATATATSAISGPMQSALDACVSRNGGEAVVGKPFNNGGGAAPHLWGNGLAVDRTGGSIGVNMCMLKANTTTAWNVRGAIRAAYLASGGPNGMAGYPTEDEGPRVAGGFARQTFEGGEFRHTAGRYVFEPAGPKAATEVFPISCPPTGFSPSKTSGPLVIDGKSDVVISGVKISNPSGSCISVRGGSRNVRIENSEIGPCYKYGVAVLDSTSVTVSNNYIHDVMGNAVHIEKGALVEARSNCLQRAMSGVFVQDSRVIAIERNSIRNVKRLRSGDAPEATLKELEALYRGQAVQFNRVNDGGNRIACNLAQNDPGLSNAEDAFNVHTSNGTSQAPIDVVGNRVFGGGPSKTGGGVLIGDGGGSYQVLRGNVGSNPGQYGIAIAGGSHMSMYGNTVFGAAQPNFTNVGMYIWKASEITPTCDDVNIAGNRIKYFSGDGKENPFWDGKNCSNVKIGANDLHASIGAEVIDTIPAECR